MYARAEICDQCGEGVITGGREYTLWRYYQPRKTQECRHPGGHTNTQTYIDTKRTGYVYRDYTCDTCDYCEQVELYRIYGWRCGQDGVTYEDLFI